MHLHRTAHQRFFTTIGNEVLRDTRLGFCARGILGHLLSLPDGHPVDIRTVTGWTPTEGRVRVAAAMRELERLGYLRREVKQTPEGHLYTDVHLFDTPGGGSSQLTPDAHTPGSGESGGAPYGDHPVKKQAKEPNLPPAPTDEDEQPGREGDDIEETAVSIAVLARVSRAEPRLSLGHAEAAALAPLVTEWRRRGASDLHIIGALTTGLPAAVYSPAALVADRLRRKMPAERAAATTRYECAGCAAPIPSAGRCLDCQRPDAEPLVRTGNLAQVRTRGAALARAALRGMPIGAMAPA
jgi:hypothetical protein